MVIQLRPNRLLGSARVLMARGGMQRAAKLRERYLKTGDLSALREAIRHAFTALRLAPADHLDEADAYGNLASLLSMYFEVNADREALELSVGFGRRAIDKTVDGDRGLAMLLSNHGGSLMRSAALNDDDALFAEAEQAGAAGGRDRFR